MFLTAQEILRFRGLVATLVGRELKARYRGSALGFFWSLANPLLLTVVYTFVFGFVFHPPRTALAQPYALFLISGLFPWIWVSTSLIEGTLSLLANAGLIRKSVFPAEILPVVSVLSNLVHFLLALPVLAGALLIGRYLGYPVGGWSALLLPAVIAVQLVQVGGMVLGLSALNAHFKDVKDILINVLTLLFFVTPILYPLEAVSVAWLARLVHWFNPFTPFTLAYQDVLFRGAVPEPIVWISMAGWAIASWILGALLFRRLSESLVEVV
jgi:ABC-type polysaccharide/polyol phosphate export permease